MFHFIVVGLGGIILAANAYPRHWNEDIDRDKNFVDGKGLGVEMRPEKEMPKLPSFAIADVLPYKAVEYRKYDGRPPEIDENGFIVTYPDRQIDDPASPESGEGDESLEVKNVRPLCLSRNEVGTTTPVPDSGELLLETNSTVITPTVARQSTANETDIEEPMKLITIIPLCDD